MLRNIAAQKEQQQHNHTNQVMSPDDGRGLNSINNSVVATNSEVYKKSCTDSQTDNPSETNTNISPEPRFDVSDTNNTVYTKLRLLSGHGIHHQNQQSGQHQIWQSKHYPSSWYSTQINNKCNLIKYSIAPASNSRSQNLVAFDELALKKGVCILLIYL